MINIQPSNGGFLEAVPLTSFVVMALGATGKKDSVVIKKGVRFLLYSLRADGSWPIDTNLATWVTTLSINALAVSPDFINILDKELIQLDAELIMRESDLVFTALPHTVYITKTGSGNRKCKAQGLYCLLKTTA